MGGTGIGAELGACVRISTVYDQPWAAAAGMNWEVTMGRGRGLEEANH